MIRVVQRALTVLECFDLERPHLSLHDISLRIALPKSTTFRILSTLLAQGYLVQVDKQEYALSHKLVRLAGVAQHSLGPRDLMHPVLRRLALETGETAEVSMLDGDGRICLDVVESSSSLKSLISVGTRLPLLLGATGKVLLAHLDADAIDRAIATHPDVAIDRAALERQLAAIRAEGYALTRDERVLGATAISVPVGDGGDRVRYSLTITGPSGRFVGREDQVRVAALAAASELSMLLGIQVRPRAPEPESARTPAPAESQAPPVVRVLPHLRVLDLTQNFGYASKVYADLGATTILVEPPGGIAARQRASFLDDRPGPDHGLPFQYLSAGKCSVVVDFEQPNDVTFFARLLEDTDLVIDDQHQDVWVERGLGFGSLVARHPRLVWCAITPFGQHGPRAGEHPDDLTVAAAGGMGWLAGDGEDVAMVPRGVLANHSAAQYAATASLVALFGQARAEGQFIDVSMQDVAALGAGAAPRQAVGGVYRCRDGFVLLRDAEDGPGTGWRDLIEWMATSLPEAARLCGPTWQAEGYEATNEAKATFRELFTRFAAHRRKQDLLEEGQRRGFAVTPVNEADETVWLDVTPWRAGRRAPRLGEHTERLRKRLKIAPP